MRPGKHKVDWEGGQSGGQARLRGSAAVFLLVKEHLFCTHVSITGGTRGGLALFWV